MKRILAGFATAGLLTVGLTACGGDNALCDADIDEASASDPAAALDTLREYRDDAPSEIQGDFDTLIEALEATESGDLEGLDPAALNESVENITTWEQENC